MALRYCDSFDHYATAFIPSKWDSVSGAPTVTSGSARFGAGGLTLTNNNTFQGVTKVLTSQPTWIIGWAWKIDALPGGINTVGPLFINDGAVTHLTMDFTSGGLFNLNGPGGILGTSVTPVVAATFYYLELKVTIGDSGTFEFRIDGTTQFSGTGDTRNAGNASADRIQFRAMSGVSAGTRVHSVDDLYICDSTGSTNNDFLGDCRVECIFPNGNGNSSQFDGSDGNTTDNYLLVDETSPDSDTTYVESADVGDEDTYAYSNLTTAAGTVLGVQPLAFAEKTNAGSRQIVTVARLAGTEENSLAYNLSTSYLYKYDVRETKPGGGAWTISDVNSAEFGPKVSG